MGNSSAGAFPVLHRRIAGGITLLTLLGTGFLIAISLPSNLPSLGYGDRIQAELSRTEPCSDSTAAADLGVHDSAHCQVLLVELMQGPDTGQLVSVTPIFSARPFVASGIDSDSGEVIWLRSQDRDGATIYHFAERNRTSVIFALVALMGVSVLLAGHWSGMKTLTMITASMVILVAYSVPGLLDRAGTSSVTVVALATALSILAVGIVVDGPLRSPAHLAFLGAALPTVAMIGLGTVAIDYLRIEDPVSADFVALSPLQAGSNLASFALLGLTVGSLLLIRSSAQNHVDNTLTLRDTQPQADSGTIFYAALQQGRTATMNGTGVFVMASLSGALPLLVLLNAEGIAPSQALNNGLFASVVVRICVGVIGLAVVGPVATGLATAAAPRVNVVDRSGESHHPRPPRRREATEAPSMIIDLNTRESEGEQSLTTRLRVGVEDN